MKKANNTVQKKLSGIQMKSLSTKEADLVWEHVRFNMNRNTPHARKSPFSSALKKSIAITLIFGLTTGTAFAADNAKPGDALFPVDRALENIQLSLASGNNKDALKVKFALERVTEVKDILNEVAVQQTDTLIKLANVEEDIVIMALPEDAAEQVVEVPPTIKKIVETPPQPKVAPRTTTDVETQISDDSISEDTAAEDVLQSSENTVSANASGTSAVVKSASSSKASLQKEISDNDKKRIELALGTALSFLGDVKGELAEQGNTDAVEYIDVMLSQINKDIGTLPSEVTFEVHVSAKKERVSFEVTSQDNKPALNIEVKDEEPAVEPESTQTDVVVSEAPKPKPKPTESKLEIKDGEIKITKATEETENSKEATSDSDMGKVQEEPAKEPESLPSENSEEIVSETASSSKDILPTSETQLEDDGTTSVKVIFKKWNGDFEFTVTDQNASLHNIITDYTEKDPDTQDTSS